MAPEVPPSTSNEGGDSSKRPTSSVRASTVTQLLILKPFSIVLIVATNHFTMVLAQGNFTVLSTNYNCSSNVICLGEAHEYIGDASNRMEVGRLSLIHEAGDRALSNSGIAYYNMPVKLLDTAAGQSVSFSTSFTVDVVWGSDQGSSGQGDGMAFVISANNSYLGASGSSLGIFNENGITTSKSIVVEFNIWQDPDYPVNDTTGNHVSFYFGNTTFEPAPMNASDVNVPLVAALTKYAWVEYSKSDQQIEVRISLNNSRPITPALSYYPVDLFDAVEEYMWVGFSSAVVDSFSNFYIGNWNFEAYGIGAPSPVAGPALAPTPLSPVLTGGRSNRNKLGLYLGISLGIPFFLLACIALVVHRTSVVRGRLGWAATDEEDPMMQLEGMPERFSYKLLSVATRGFSEESKLGQGGFGSVYRGVLPGSGIAVAVKKVSGDSSQGEKEFMAEVSIISRLRHRNLIQLLGWCKDTSKGQYLIVYELMPNGSLDKVLFGPTESQTRLSWTQRFNIVTGTAAALEYLHQGWKQQIIHRDIKSSNIILDEVWNAKLGDFGLARLVDHQREAATTLMAGTYGYIAPEVAASGKFTDKTDVFAFGAVILEVACGRKALCNNVPEDERILVDWVWHRLSEGDMMSTVDKRLGEGYDKYWMEVMLTVGLLCSHPNPHARPSMRHVVEVFAGDVPVPPISASKPSTSEISSDFQSGLKGYSDNSKSGSIPKLSRSGSISLGSVNTSGATGGSMVTSFGMSSASNSSPRHFWNEAGVAMSEGSLMVD